MSETLNLPDLIERLNIKADVIGMGEKIAWGSDSAIMREAAHALEVLSEKVLHWQEKAQLPPPPERIER